MDDRGFSQVEKTDVPYLAVSALPDDALFVVKKTGPNMVYNVELADVMNGMKYPDPAFLPCGSFRDRAVPSLVIGGGMEDGLVITKKEAVDLGIKYTRLDRNADKYVRKVLSSPDKAPSEKVQMRAVRLRPTLIREDASPRVQREAVNKATKTMVPLIVSSIAKKHQDRVAMDMAAVKNPASVLSMEEGLKEMFLQQAVRQSPLLIKDIPNPSKKLQYEAVMENPRVIDLIDRPDPDIRELAEKKIADEKVPKILQNRKFREGGREVDMILNNRRLAEAARTPVPHANDDVDKAISMATEKMRRDGRSGCAGPAVASAPGGRD